MKRIIELKLVGKAFKEPKPDATGRPQWDEAGKLVTVDVDLSWADRLRDLVKSGLPAGTQLTIAEMIELQEVWNAVKDGEDGKPLIIEDAEHKLLKKHLARLAWSGFDPSIAELLHAVMEAPEWKPPEPERDDVESEA